MIVSLIAMGVSAASSAVSGVMKHRAQKREDARQQAALLREQTAQNNWYSKEYYQNPLERSENQALLNWQKKALKDATDRQTATAKITGATPEAQQAAQQRYANSVADATSRIAANESARRDNLSNGWRTTMSALRDRQNALNSQQHATKMQNIDRFAQQAGALAKTAASAFASSDVSGKVKTPDVSLAQPSGNAGAGDTALGKTILGGVDNNLRKQYPDLFSNA